MDLKAKMVVDSIRWGLERQGIPVYIEHKGDNNAGAIFIAHNRGNGLYDVYHRVYDYIGGKRIKLFDTFTEERLKEFFKKQTDIDPDLWLIEVDSKEVDLNYLFVRQGL